MAVTESEVRAAIASGATTRALVTQHCRAGGDCGACHGMIDQMVEDHLEDVGAVSSGAGPRLPSCPPAATSGERLVAADQLVRGPRAA